MAAKKETPSSVWPTARRAWYVATLLTAAYALAYLDRQILNLVLQPMKVEFAISDTQASLLGGTAFALFYVTLGVPFAWVADRWRRKELICAGILVWSTMTACCAFADNYQELFLARVGVGIGEATLTPAALSLIGDSFSPSKRTRPLAIYMLGATLGPAIALGAGGAMLSMFEEGATIPIFGHLNSWRMLFLVAGFAGLPLFVLLLTVQEPVRRDTLAAPDQSAGAGQPGVISFMFRHHRAAFLSVLVGWGGIALNMILILVWSPTLMVRKYDWAPADIGMTLGMVVLIAGLIGVWAGPSLVRRLERAGRPDAYVRAALIFTLAMFPTSVLAPVMPSATAAMVMFGISLCFNFASASLVPGTLQAFTPNELRARVTAVFTLVNNVIALGAGPVLVGISTDYLFQRESALDLSMALVSLAVLPLACFALRAGEAAFGRDVLRYRNSIARRFSGLARN